jgi:hypothetical protein
MFFLFLWKTWHERVTPKIDKFIQGAGTLGYWAIKGREQQLIDFHGGIGNPQVANLIRGVWYFNPNGRIYHFLSDLAFGNIAPYTGF